MALLDLKDILLMLGGSLLTAVVSIKVIEVKITELTRLVLKHNGMMEKTYRLEEQMKVANHRISNLEKKGNYYVDGTKNMD